ncbi:hypothetical protein LJC02_02395, partial [Breznakia sp. OttesenSCG-928-G09]|nr:hypothetical protein [Breznakia sp. OttesenSCG-928-G09]
KNGSKGTYPYADIVNCMIANDDAKFKGKDEPFKHTVLSGMFQMTMFTNKYVYVGVIFEMRNHQKVYVYVYNEQCNSMFCT